MAIDAFRPKPGESIISIEIEMHVFKEKIVAGDAHGAGLGQSLLGVAELNAIAVEVLGCAANGRVDPGIGAKGQGVLVAGRSKFFEGVSIRESQFALGQAEMGCRIER